MNNSAEKNSFTRRNFLFRAVISMITFFSGVFGTLLFKRSEATPVTTVPETKKSNRGQENPYEYKLDPLKKIDPELITYRETNQIKINLNEPKAIAADNKDTIYVTGDKTLLTFDAEGSQTGTFELPAAATCLFVDARDQIFVGYKDHIEIIDTKGKKLSEFHSLGELAYVTCIAASKEYVFIADAGNRVVWRFNRNGALSGHIGEKDVRQGIPGLVVPSPYLDILLDDKDHLWIVNPGRHSLEQYTTDGKLLTSWKKTSMQIQGFCGCCNPTHIARLSDGALVTSEKGLERIKIHETDGSFRTVVAAPSQFKEGTVGLDLAVDSKDRVLVLDPVLKAVRVFEH